MIVKTLTVSDAKRIFDAWKGDEPVDLADFEHSRGNGDPLPDNAIDSAVEALEDIRSNETQSVAGYNRFDSSACCLLHQHLGLDADVAGDPGFWTWLAMARFRGLVEWRHPSDGSGTHSRNYGVGNKWANLLARLWFRAELAFEAGAGDGYHLARRGPIDFWESGIIRTGYSSCRPLVRGLVRFQYPTDDAPPTLSTSITKPPSGVRVLYKLLARLQPTISLEMLNDEEAESLIQSIAADLRRSGA